ncbi:hypothetical protein PanWU01x14_204150 [Parasponia andersonii]|uniref:Uncharacterized protein n=1 Tax=Parasponia andersonii TaxID=3476 RepID=A0A2P5BWK0_PARAD|nr:hypothetical protein PanWU01x14_204150 [Parasponia andersonii]
MKGLGEFLFSSVRKSIYIFIPQNGVQMNEKLLLKSAPLKWKMKAKISESHVGGKCLVQVVYKEPCFVMVVRITTTDALSGERRGVQIFELGPEFVWARVCLHLWT